MGELCSSPWSPSHRFPLIPLPIIEAIKKNQRNIMSKNFDLFPLIPLPIIEAMKVGSATGLYSTNPFPLIPLPIIEAISMMPSKLSKCFLTFG